MNGRPSERCGGCVWWHEGPLMCKGCPNNPDTRRKKAGGD
jgi:hypothetical protein